MPDAGLGFDVFGVLGVIAQLLPKAVDEHPHILILVAVLRPPNCVEQRAVGKHLATMHHKLPE